MIAAYSATGNMNEKLNICDKHVEYVEIYLFDI